MELLQEYKRKRDFTKTPEPPPKLGRKTETLSYLIQKHDATRLHYDFRLEWNGVLLSWAVTKGPSLNPADKRLAVRTEDHPLDYGTFEGTIPQGQYGGGTVMLWDNGTWEPKGDVDAGLKKGHLSFILHGKRLKGGWDLIRMQGDEKRENWLLIKEKDEEASTEDNEEFLAERASSIATGRTMERIAREEDNVWGEPKKKKTKTTSKKDKKKASGAPTLQALIKQYPGVQLATLVDQPPQGDSWLHEIKFDGYRLLGFLSDGDVALMTRNGNDWTDRFPAIRKALAELPASSAVIDMEAVVVDKEGKTSFQGLQAALGNGGNTASIIAYAFDILHLNGEDLSHHALIERKNILDDLLKKSDKSALLFSEHITGHGDEIIRKSCALGLEGIVSKQTKDPYVAGRGRSWLKSKCIKRQEFIILGYMNARKGERAIGALYLGYYDKKQLMYAGKVGTGFTMQSARNLRDKLEKLKTATKPALNDFPGAERRYVQWVRPRLLCEVAFTEWTTDGHIRHPSFQGLREDKPLQTVVHEKPLHLDREHQVTEDRGRKLIGGISVSHPDRVIFDDIGVTKGELVAYFDAMSPLMMPQLENRPLSLLRCPEGIKGQCFFQRSPGRGLGADVYPFKWKHKGKDYEYLYIKDKKGLLELAQMGVIEIHPWGSRIDNIDYPDRVIFDLDPDKDVPFEAVKLAAQDVRARLKKQGLESFLKCTGGKGLHVTVPLAEKDPWPKVKEWAGRLAHEMAAEVPEAYVAAMSKAKRAGRIFIDYLRNDYTATAIADYGVRARPGAHVALPLEWKDLKKLKSADAFNIRDVLALAKKGKLAGGFEKIPQWVPD